MIALGYGVTLHLGHGRHHPDLQVPAALVGRRREQGREGVRSSQRRPNVDDTGLNGYRPVGLRAYRLENKQTAGKTIAQFRQSYPQYRILNVVRAARQLGASPIWCCRWVTSWLSADGWRT